MMMSRCFSSSEVDGGNKEGQTSREPRATCPSYGRLSPTSHVVVGRASGVHGEDQTVSG